MKRNPRPRKYASDAERQAAFRARNVMVEFRAENKTADTLNKIADEIDVSRSDLVLSMVKFALTNHDWARFGLTHKTIPLYKGNPMGKDLPFKPTNTNLENEAKFLENYAKDSLNTWIVLGQTEKYSEIMEDVNLLRHTKKIKGLNNRAEYLTKYFEKVKKGDFYKGNPMATKKPSPAQLAARQKFADMVRARAAAAKGKKMPRKNPTDFFIEKFHLGGKMYAQIIEKSDHTYDMYIYQMQSTGIKGEGNYEQFFDSKNYKTKSGAMRGLEKWAKQHEYSVTSQLHSNPRKKTVSQKISQLEHEGYPHKQSIAIALSEQRRGKVKRNPISGYTVFHRGTSNIAGQVMASGAETAKKMVAEKLGIPSVAYLIAKKETNKQGFYAKNPSNEIPAYEITRNFKVLGIFQTKADAIKAAQGISDATGKTIAVKPVQVLAGHFDR
jgi:metal-responsive CopG/Arc/MetJ family transcriptional regulator